MVRFVSELCSAVDDCHARGLEQLRRRALWRASTSPGDLIDAPGLHRLCNIGPTAILSSSRKGMEKGPDTRGA